MISIGCKFQQYLYTSKVLLLLGRSHHFLILGVVWYCATGWYMALYNPLEKNWVYKTRDEFHWAQTKNSISSPSPVSPDPPIQSWERHSSGRLRRCTQHWVWGMGGGMSSGLGRYTQFFFQRLVCFLSWFWIFTWAHMCARLVLSVQVRVLMISHSHDLPLEREPCQ